MTILKRVWLAIKVIGLLAFGFILALLIATVAFLNLSPQFGGSPTEAQQAQYAQTGHYEDGQFILDKPVSTSTDQWATFQRFMKDVPTQTPQTTVQPQRLDSLDIVNHDPARTRLTWFGHSSFLLEMDGKRILLDPMLGEYASPLPLESSRRWTEGVPISAAALPAIDAVLFSHDHYDHLDYETVTNLKEKVGHWYVPLGLSAHLLAWGVDESKVSEYDWWEEAKLGEIQLVCVPAQHFSGRGIFDRMATLWCSWVITGDGGRIYFSGDGGYGDHFKEIGDQYGPFDIALLECGQYDQDWAHIHMMPEETVKAGLDVRAEKVLPIHWGAFKLALHDWKDPIYRVIAAAKEQGVQLTTPQIGEPVVLGESYPTAPWWDDYK